MASCPKGSAASASEPEPRSADSSSATRSSRTRASSCRQYKNLGGVQGGGIAEGVGYEAEARIMAMNPFLTLEQSRQVMQAGLKGGYSGKNLDTVTQFLTENLKEMNLSVADSMELVHTNVDKGKMSAEELGESLRSIKEMGKPEYGQKSKHVAHRGVQTGLRTDGWPGSGGRGAGHHAKAVTQMFAGDRVLGHVMARHRMKATRALRF